MPKGYGPLGRWAGPGCRVKGKRPGGEVGRRDGEGKARVRFRVRLLGFSFYFKIVLKIKLKPNQNSTTLFWNLKTLKILLFV
jgi:hypothetical protein